MKLRLAEESEPLVTGIRIQPWSGATAEAVKDFTLLVSNDSEDDSDFVPVLSATILNDGTLQEFALPAALCGHAG